MESEKSLERDTKSVPDSAGDRRTGSVGERPELAGSRDSDARSPGTKHKSEEQAVEDEIAGYSDSEPA